ncbi:MAG: hypothetical protein RQ922_03110 [Thermoproteota archaeon]|jgi:hypothetical protein|nr:hypothetical protein [Thermoproteota archaeon]
MVKSVRNLLSSFLSSPFILFSILLSRLLILFSRKYEEILRSHPGIITGYWIGWKHGEPYIMVAIEKGKCEDSEKLLPDKLGDYDVYYIEGSIHLTKPK